MKTKFAMETVLRLRQRERDQAALAVSEIRNAIEKYQAEIAEVVAQTNQLSADRRASSIGNVPVSSLIDIQRFQIQLVMQVQSMREKELLLLEEATKREKTLLLCQQNLKAMELLEEHHQLKVKASSERALQSRLDEWSNTRVSRDKAIGETAE